MTPAELLAASLVLSTLVALLAWSIGGLMERRVRDARLRERAWAVAFYVAALPTLLIGLALLTPAPTVLVAASVETGAFVQNAVGSDAVFRIDRDAFALGLLAVAALFSILRAGSLIHRIVGLGALVRRTAPAAADLVAVVDQVARDLGVRPPKVRIGANDVGPLLTGFRRPLLVLPSAFAARPEAAATRAVCAHELAHLKRGDHRAVWSEEFLLILLAANPMLRLIRDRRAAAREEACDALALARTPPEARRHYARALIDAFRNHSHPSPRPALAFISNRRSFAMNRLNAILNPAAPAGRGARSLALAAGVAIAALVGAASFAVAAQREAVAVPMEAPVATAAASAPVIAASGVAAAPLPAALPLPDVEAEPAPSAPDPSAAPAAAAQASVSATAHSMAQAAATAAAQSAAAAVTGPAWAQMPAPQYPAEAAAAGVEQAEVTLSCTVGTAGAITDCSVLNEDPVGVGFGAAAIRAAEAARLAPGGGYAEGAAFQFRVRFRLS